MARHGGRRGCHGSEGASARLYGDLKEEGATDRDLWMAMHDELYERRVCSTALQVFSVWAFSEKYQIIKS